MKKNDTHNRLNVLRESVNDSSRSFRTAYTFYLIVGSYILLLVSATNQELLFRAGEVQMPVINVGVSVVSFFVISPWILLILHFNLLLQAIFLSAKISQYATALNQTTTINSQRNEAFGLLFPISLTHFLSKGDQRKGTKILLSMMISISIIFFPVVILLYIQTKYLVYQDELTTWLHRAAIVADIGLLWWLWPRITATNQKWRDWWRTQWRASSLRLGLLLFLSTTVTVLLFVLAIVDSSGGRISQLSPSLDAFRDLVVSGRQFDLSGRAIVAKEPSPEILSAYYRATCRSTTSDGIHVHCNESAIDLGAPIWCKFAEPLRFNGRSFRSANFAGSTFCGAVFRNSNFTGANLSETKLYGASFTGSTLRDVDLSNAMLPGAKLVRSDLSGSTLWRTQLSGADLTRTKLNGAILIGVNLNGAALNNAELHITTLADTQLQGADLGYAQLYGAHLKQVRLQGADLYEADLIGIYMSEVELRGATLARSKLLGAYIIQTDFDLTDLREINIKSETVPPDAALQGMINGIDNGKVQEQFEMAIQRAKDGKIMVVPRTVANAVMCRTKTFSKLLLEAMRRQGEFQPAKIVECNGTEMDKLNEYFTDLTDYLVKLSCSDRFGYVTKGVASRAIANPSPSGTKLDSARSKELSLYKTFQPMLANKLLNANCTGVASGLKMLKQTTYADLLNLADRSSDSQVQR